MATATLSMSLEDAIVATLPKYDKTLADNVFLNNALVKGVKKYDGVIRMKGGNEKVINLEYAMGNEVWFSRGETISDDTPDTMGRISVPLKNLAVPVKILWEDEQANKGDETKIIDYVEAKIKNVESTGSDRLEYRSWQAGNAANVVTGIPDLIGTGSIFGLDGATYDWWQSQVQTTIGDFDTNGLDKMGAVHTAMLSKGKGDGAKIADVCMGDADFYEAFLQKADERHYLTKEDAALGPYKGPGFRGTPVMLAPYAPAGEFVMLNFKFLKLIYAIDFELTKFKDVPKTVGDRVAYSVFRGAWAPSNRRVQGKGTGMTY